MKNPTSDQPDINPTTGKALYFTQSLPISRDGKDVAGLLRHVSKTLDAMGNVEILDISFEHPYSDDNPSIGFFFNTDDTSLIEEYGQDSTLLRVSLQCSKDASPKALFDQLGQILQDSGVKLPDIAALNFQNILDEDAENAYILNAYYTIR